jgi:putative peptidoglycan lipid II flippase
VSAATIALPGQRSLGHIMTSVASVSLAVQVCSFASSVALARVLGASVETDAYYLGLSIPALTYGVFIGALRTGAIPALTNVVSSRGVAALERSASEVLSGVLVTSVALTVLVTGVVEVALPLFAGGRLLDLTRVILLELAPYAVLGAMTGVLSAVLAVRGTFAIPVAALALEPITKVILIVAFGHEIGVQALVLGNLVGGSLTVALLWHVVRRKHVSLRVVRRFDTPFVRTTAFLCIPLVASSSILLVNPVVDRTMASGFGHGSITALELGLRLFLVPAGLMTGLLIAPMTATWAARKAEGGWPSLQGSVTRALTLAAAVLPPIVVLGIVLRHQLVALLFQGGAYPTGALHQTTAVFGMILLALPAQMAIVVFSTLFIVQKDTVFPLKVACLNVVLNIALNFALRPIFGVAGIALSTSLTYTLLLVVYAVGARRRWGVLYEGDLLPVIVRVVVSVAVMVSAAMLLIAALPTAGSRPVALLVVVVVATIGMIIHAAVLMLGRDPLAVRTASQLHHLVVRVSR